MLPAVPLQARAYGNACNAKPAVFHVPAADPMTGPDAFRGQALHRRLLRPVRRAAENLLLAPKKALAGEAVCKIRNAVYLKGYTAFCAQEQDVFAFNLFGRRRY